MIKSQSYSATNLNDILAFLNYQGPLYLRRVENLPPKPTNSSDTSTENNLPSPMQLYH